MTTKKIELDFDFMKFKEQVQNEMYEELKNLTLEEQIKYVQEKAESGSLGEWWKSVKSKSS